MKTLAVPFIALTLAIGGCASMGGGEAEEKKIEVVTDNLEKMEDSKEVYLGQFSVTFVVKDKASATSESGMFSKDRAYAKAILKSELKGIPEETMQPRSKSSGIFNKKRTTVCLQEGRLAYHEEIR